MARKVLIATSCRWFSAARLAIAFGKAGCAVEVLCPPDHPVLSTRVIHRHHIYNGLTPLRSLQAAILSARPDLVVPCDDLMMRQMHRLHALSCEKENQTSQMVRSLLESSLGAPAGYPYTESRDRFIELVREEKIQTPETQTVQSVEEVESWLAGNGFPAVLKADGTSAGEGVRIVENVTDAVRAYRTLRSPLQTVVVAKRAWVDRDWNGVIPWLSRRPRAISIQSFVTGPDTNVAIACWQGEILASLSVEVLETWKPKGPATIIRLIKNDAMLQVATKILRRLNFSGLCGFDFILDAASGQPLLLEMNARATQTCSLPLGPGGDLIAALCAKFADGPIHTSTLELPGDTVALFPLAWEGDTASEIFQSAYADIPKEEPELVRLGMNQKKAMSNAKWARLFSKLGIYEP